MGRQEHKEESSEGAAAVAKKEKEPHGTRRPRSPSRQLKGLGKEENAAMRAGGRPSRAPRAISVYSRMGRVRSGLIRVLSVDSRSRSGRCRSSRNRCKAGGFLRGRSRLVGGRRTGRRPITWSHRITKRTPCSWSTRWLHRRASAHHGPALLEFASPQVKQGSYDA